MPRFALLVAAVAIAACDNTPSAPAAAPAAPSFAREPGESRGPEGTPDGEHQRTPFARVVNNPCPPVPEAVAVEGFTQFSSHFKFYDGGNTSRHHIVSQAKGVGAVTGAKYTFHELVRQTGDYPYATQIYDTDLTIRWHVISQGNLGNFFATTHQRVVCSATGCRVEPISFETDCKG